MRMIDSAVSIAEHYRSVLPLVEHMDMDMHFSGIAT